MHFHQQSIRWKYFILDVLTAITSTPGKVRAYVEGCFVWDCKSSSSAGSCVSDPERGFPSSDALHLEWSGKRIKVQVLISQTKK